MKKCHGLVVIIISLFSALETIADEYGPGKQYFETCMKKAIKVKPGDVIKVEMKLEDNKKVYEFDIRDEENSDWDVECEANTGEIIEVEQEVISTRDEKFYQKMGIELSEAKEIALKNYPGEIIEVEFEIESDGLPVYEFDIKMANGKEIKLEINATNGAIHEEDLELWQIGYE